MHSWIHRGATDSLLTMAALVPRGCVTLSIRFQPSIAREFTGRLPSGAFPTSCFRAAFASGFALRFRAGVVAFVTLAGLDFGLGMLSPIRGQGSADIVGFNERRAALVATHI